MIQFFLYWDFFLLNKCVKSRFLKKLINFLEGEVFWKDFMGLLQQGYIEFCFAVAINFLMYGKLNEDNHAWSSYGLYLNNILALITSVICLVYPVWLQFFMWYNYSVLDTDEYQKRYGAAYEEICLHKNPNATWLTFIFMARRLGLVLTYVLLRGQFSMQIFAHFGLLIIQVVFIFAIKPFETSFLTKLNLVNEFTIYLVIDCVMCFTDFVSNSESQVKHRKVGQIMAGHALFVIVVTSLCINVGLILLHFVENIIQQVRKATAKR